MAAKPVSTSAPAKQSRNAKPAKATTPLHGAVNHTYSEGTAKKVVKNLHC